MNAFSKTLAVTLLAASAAPALAADSLDIKVIGTITPAACVPTASGNGTFDYGTINARTLSADEFNAQNQLTQTLTIACDAPVKMALNFTDAKSDSVVIPVGAKGVLWPDGSVTSIISSSTIFGGLGMAGNAKIGAYTLGINPSSVRLDGTTTAPATITSKNKTTWSVSSAAILTGAGNPYFSFATKGTTEPLAFTQMTGDLKVQAVINKASELDLTQDITLDGQGTLQITYL